MTYYCVVNGVVEYSSNSLSEFYRYQLIYEEAHRGLDVEYLSFDESQLDELYESRENLSH